MVAAKLEKRGRRRIYTKRAGAGTRHVSDRMKYRKVAAVAFKL